MESVWDSSTNTWSQPRLPVAVGTSVAFVQGSKASSVRNTASAATVSADSATPAPETLARASVKLWQLPNGRWRGTRPTSGEPASAATTLAGGGGGGAARRLAGEAVSGGGAAVALGAGERPYSGPAPQMPVPASKTASLSARYRRVRVASVSPAVSPAAAGGGMFMETVVGASDPYEGFEGLNDQSEVTRD